MENQTSGKIRDLIPPSALDGDTRLVLTNAIYFKGGWTHKFRESSSADAAFYVTGEREVSVAMMFQSDDLKYCDSDGVQCLELPYGQHKYLSMLILLPKSKDGIVELEGKLTNENLEAWTSQMSSREVEVYLPKFRMDSEFELKTTLESMGMKLAFQSSAADFSGMSTREGMFISAAIHKAFVDVNEEGTEAAAATGIQMKSEAARLSAVFRADHPFVFLIRDNRTKSILFLGRVTDPS